MERLGLCAAILTTGCIQTGGGGFGDDLGDDLSGDVGSDAAGDADADADGDADWGGDADADGDGDPGSCPAYPAGPYGLRMGQVVQNFALGGNDTDDEWTMEDFWCLANDSRDPKTVLILNIHSMT